MFSFYTNKFNVAFSIIFLFYNTKIIYMYIFIYLHIYMASAMPNFPSRRDWKLPHACVMLHHM
jgi:hypothetical protein